MTTPAAEAIRGLVEALREAANTDHQDFGAGVCQWCGHDIDLCDEASGCLGWKMRAALDAWEKRRPLREDAELIDAVAAKLADEFGETTWNIDPDDLAGYVRITRVLLDALDAALFGPPTEEGSRGR